MTDIVEVEKIDEVFMKVKADPSVLQELSEFFSFQPNGYKFSPKYKARVWDGYIRLVTPFKPYLYIGLLHLLKQFCEIREYEIVVDKELSSRDDVPDDYGYQIAKELGTKLKPHDYQNDYVVNALRNNRALSLSPTSSGKSFMQYLLVQHYYRSFQYRTLIVVPTISLVHQMAGDFIDYGCDPDMVYKIQGGVEKITDKTVVISTWQSLKNMTPEWFNQFGVVIGDEAHLFTGKSLIEIMEKCTSVKYRFGFTGTISSESKTHQLVLQGLFGEIKRYVSTKDLIDSGTVANFKIKAIVLGYEPELRKQFRTQVMKLEKKKRYVAEREFIVNNHKRNLFIRNLVWSLEGQNNLILFELVEKHGKILEPLLRREGRELHFIHGSISGEAREEVRSIVENDPIKRHDILASSGTFSTGTNLKKLDNLILVNAGKSEVRNLQSIGRTLRKGNDADNATLYDLTDDLSIGTYRNYTLDHFRKRIEVYSSEQFPLKIINVDLN